MLSTIREHIKKITNESSDLGKGNIKGFTDRIKTFFCYLSSCNILRSSFKSELWIHKLLVQHSEYIITLASDCLTEVLRTFSFPCDTHLISKSADWRAGLPGFKSGSSPISCMNLAKLLHFIYAVTASSAKWDSQQLSQRALVGIPWMGRREHRTRKQGSQWV